MARKSKPDRYWTNKEEVMLRQYYFEYGMELLCKVLKRSAGAIRQRARRLKLNKTEYMRLRRKHNIRG